MNGPDPAKASQSAALLEYLRAGHSITQLDATTVIGSTRLAARIKDLRYACHSIKTEMITVGILPSGRPVRVASYSLIIPEPSQP